MTHDHMTACAVAVLGDGCARGEGGSFAAYDPIDMPGHALILFHAF